MPGCNDNKMEAKKRAVGLCVGGQKIHDFIKSIKENHGLLSDKILVMIELNENKNNVPVLPYETKSGNKMDIIYLENNNPICTFEINGTVSCFGYQITNIVDVHICV